MRTLNEEVLVINLVCCIITAYFFKLFFIPQVWYLLGWLYYLQPEKPGTAEDSESLKKSSRIYLTKAKKVILYTRKYLRSSVLSFLFSWCLHSAGFFLLLTHRHTLLGLLSIFFSKQWWNFFHAAGSRETDMGNENKKLGWWRKAMREFLGRGT